MITELNEYEEFLKQFKLLNIISAEFRNVCTLLGTEIDCTLLRTNLIQLQRYMMHELKTTQNQLIKCWRNANTGLSTTITSEQSDQLFSVFTTYVEYHMRALLKTLHLITLFPSINLRRHSNTDDDDHDDVDDSVVKEESRKKIRNNELANHEIVTHNDSSWILASNKLLQTNINSLINTGYTKALELSINQTNLPLLINDIDEENDENIVNLSEIDILKNEYRTLQTTINDMSSLICVTPWNVLAFPVDIIEQRLSLQESTSTIHQQKSQPSHHHSFSKKSTITNSSICSSNISTTFGQNRVHILPTIDELPLHSKLCDLIKNYFKQKRIFAFLLIGTFIITCLIILLILFIVIFPSMKSTTNE
ncbi:unnamed protein product [Schistosoma turkestanicum]|nr:unnamed protein product [Schistosoma turkestanicum]